MSKHNAVSYARIGAEIEHITGKSTITLLIPDWPLGFSDLPCGLRPPRRPSRVMEEPVAGLMGIDLVVNPIGEQGCGWAAPALV